jgi:hypothetical protein
MAEILRGANGNGGNGGNGGDGGAVVYQVQLAGELAELLAGHLSGMVETACGGCGVKLLAEGAGFDHAVRLARQQGQQLLPICVGCYRAATGDTGPLERTAPVDPYHEEELAALLRAL